MIMMMMMKEVMAVMMIMMATKTSGSEGALSPEAFELISHDTIVVMACCYDSRVFVCSGATGRARTTTTCSLQSKLFEVL